MLVIVAHNKMQLYKGKEKEKRKNRQGQEVGRPSSKNTSAASSILNQRILNAGEIEGNPPRPETTEAAQPVLENFSRAASGGAFIVSDVPAGPLPDLYPPSQITDLQATLDGEEITLTWTAPGEDYDTGKGKNKESCRFDAGERCPM